MKKNLLTIELLVVGVIAAASYGGSTILAHAQSLTPTQSAALEQQLDVAKAQLVQLQMQSGAVPAGDNSLSGGTTVTPSVSQTMPLSASDISAMNQALTALTGVLTNLQSEIATNPQFIATNGASVVATLQGIGNTVASIGASLTGGSIAMNLPQPTVGTSNGASGIAQTTPPTAPSAPATGITGSATGVSAAAAPAVAETTTPALTNPLPAISTSQTASGFSFGKLNWPLIIVIILIIAAIAIWLWWDDGEEKNRPVVVKPVHPVQQKPTVVNITSTSQHSAIQTNQTQTPSQTPMSAAMANQQQQQKKTA